VLLMDEPFSAVDPVVRASLQTELLRLQDELRKTIVFVTHDIDEAIKLGDMVGVFRVGGGLVQYDTPQHLLSAPVDEFVAGFLGVDRGIRGLSFLPASTVTLAGEPVIEAGTPVRTARASAAGNGAGWLLVVDADRRPAGWLPPDALDGNVEAAKLAPLQRTFRPDHDSLRVALDTLSVLLRNVVDGLRSVPESVRQSATAMGFGPLRRLVQVELPIAAPVVIAGTRVATVSNISLVSVGGLIGLGGLGQLFTDGFQLHQTTRIIMGIVLTVALAVVADGILVVVQRVLTPWARRGDPARQARRTAPDTPATQRTEVMA
jgi:hypothetical protein